MSGRVTRRRYRKPVDGRARFDRVATRAGFVEPRFREDFGHAVAATRPRSRRIAELGGVRRIGRWSGARRFPQARNGSRGGPRARVRHSWSWRRRFPDRHQVARGRGQRVVARAVDRRRERRRRRARIVQGPRAAPPQPVSGARGRADRRACSWGRHGDRRDEARVRAGSGARACRDRRARAGGLDRRRHADCRRRSDGVPPRRRDCAARGDRRSPSVPAHRAALPARRRRSRRARGRRDDRLRSLCACRDGGAQRRVVGAAHARRQRRDARARHARVRARHRLVSLGRHRTIPRHGRVHRVRRHTPRGRR